MTAVYCTALLDPPFEADVDLENAVEVANGVYGTMQRKILEVEMRNVYFQSIAKREFARLERKQLVRVAQSSELLAKFMQTLPVTDLRYIRPEKVLPVAVAGFDDQAGISQSFKAGWTDVGRGFTAYD